MYEIMSIEYQIRNNERRGNENECGKRDALYLKDKLHRVEKRALRIMAPRNLNYPPSIFEAGDRLFHGMFCAILSGKGHPLRELFDERDPGVTHAGQILKPPFARTKRFKESYIKFAS